MIVKDSESFGIMWQIAAILAKKSQVAETESSGATYVPLNTAVEAGILAV